MQTIPRSKILQKFAILFSGDFLLTITLSSLLHVPLHPLIIVFDLQSLVATCAKRKRSFAIRLQIFVSKQVNFLNKFSYPATYSRHSTRVASN